MALSKILGLFLIHVTLLLSSCFAEDPSVFYNFEVSYITASPLGVPQQIIKLQYNLTSCLDLFARLWFPANDIYSCPVRHECSYLEVRDIKQMTVVRVTVSVLAGRPHSMFAD
ncbi:hypothetical protein V6N13_073447 [Hibiscus sabdariffa]